MKKDGSVLGENLSCKMLLIYFSSKLECDFYIVSIAKTASNRSVALIRSVKFLLPVFHFNFYKSTIQACMEYSCYVWAGTPCRYLDMLDKLQKRICRTAGASLASSFEPLALHQNVTSFLSIVVTSIDVHLY